MKFVCTICRESIVMEESVSHTQKHEATGNNIFPDGSPKPIEYVPEHQTQIIEAKVSVQSLDDLML